MNIKDFDSHLAIIRLTDGFLTEEENWRAWNSLVIHQSENKFQDVFFWGKIGTLSGSYYVAFGTYKDCFRSRKFYYSLDCLEWFLLPNVKEELQQYDTPFTKPLSGDPGREIRTSVLNLNEENLRFEEQAVALKEEQLLANLVGKITDEAAAVPRGSLFSSTEETITFNPMFRGLKPTEAVLLSNWQHFREPKNEFSYNMAKHDSSNYAVDFLDSLDDDIPKGKSFRVTEAQHGNVHFVHSLLWPGMCSFQEGGSGRCGFFYNGTGVKNSDILFHVI